jgi:hypothetical protein
MASNAGPHKPTVTFAIAMILLGVVMYLGSGMGSVTALIPAFVGIPILLMGLLAAKVRKPALIAALILAVLGFLGPFGRIIPLAMKGELGLSVAFGGQLIFMGLAAVLAFVLIAAIRKPAAN